MAICQADIFLVQQIKFCCHDQLFCIRIIGKFWQYLVLIQLRKINQFYLGCCIPPIMPRSFWYIICVHTMLCSGQNFKSKKFFEGQTFAIFVFFEKAAATPPEFFWISVLNKLWHSRVFGIDLALQVYIIQICPIFFCSSLCKNRGFNQIFPTRLWKNQLLKHF